MIFCNFLVDYMGSMYNRTTMEGRKDLYLRKQSKFYNKADIELMDMVSDSDKRNFVRACENSGNSYFCTFS